MLSFQKCWNMFQLVTLSLFTLELPYLAKNYPILFSKYICNCHVPEKFPEIMRNIYMFENVPYPQSSRKSTISPHAMILPILLQHLNTSGCIFNLSHNEVICSEFVTIWVLNLHNWADILRKLEKLTPTTKMW